MVVRRAADADRHEFGLGVEFRDHQGHARLFVRHAFTVRHDLRFAQWGATENARSGVRKVDAQAYSPMFEESLRARGPSSLASR